MINRLKLSNLIKLLENSKINIKSEFFMKDGDYRYPRIECNGIDMKTINDGNFEKFYGLEGTIHTTVDHETTKRILASNDFYNGLEYHNFFTLSYPVSSSSRKTKIAGIRHDTDWNMHRDIYNMILTILTEFATEEIYDYPILLKEFVDSILYDSDPDEIEYLPSRVVGLNRTDPICSPIVSAIAAQYLYVDFYRKASNTKEDAIYNFKGTNFYTSSGYVLKDYGMKYMEVTQRAFHQNRDIKSTGTYFKVALKKNDYVNVEEENYMKVRGYTKELSNVPNSMVLYPNNYKLSKEESDVYRQLNVNAHILRFKKLIEVYGHDITLNDLQIIKNVYSKRKMESAYTVAKMLTSQKLSEMILGLHEKTTRNDEISGEPVYRYPWNMYL